jgi:tetratricopeptide (TPR) repeat protein
MDPRLVSSPLDSGATSALPPRAAALLPGPGQLLAGRYHLGSLLGEGGMGQVWRARDVALDREVAVKVLAAPDVAEARERFLREARAAAALNHPNIVAIHDLGQESGCLFLVMELVAGGSLRERPPATVDEAVEVGRQLCAALAHAHAQGLVHRDVKPANVLLVAGATRLTVKLADLGLAMSSAASRLTVEGGIVGTVAYLAPEQAIGRVVDARADLYSLGVLLYELVTGRLPFSGTPVALISQHLHAPVVPPRSHRPDLDPALEAVILRLLAKDPAQRFASADETAAALAGSFAARPSQVLAASDPLGVLDALVRGRLVGRDSELAQLRELWRAAAGGPGGSGRCALIGGEAGAGKTRLARELAVYARLGGAVVLTGGCYEFEATTPYLPFVEALRRFVREAPAAELQRTLGDQAAVLARLAPELAVRLGPLDPAPALSPPEERLRLFDHFARWLQAVAVPRGVLLLLDDLQWADQGTLQLLHYLLRHLSGDPLLALATYRVEEVGPEHPLGLLIAELNRERLVTRVHLGRLDAAATGEVLAALFGQDSVSGQLSAAIYRETEGNPFFVEETVKGLIDQGVIYRRGDEWCRDEDVELRLPEGVRAAIARRLERLSAPCRDALQTAAALGKSFRFEDLALAGNTDEEALLDALDEARRSQLVEEERSGDRFAFTHDKIREVLYAGMNPVRRRRLHLRLGEALLARGGDRRDERRAEVLAHHFHHAGDHERGLTWSLHAAEQAQAVFAHEEALEHCRRALECAGALGRPEEEARIEETMARICMTAGLSPDAAAHYEAARALTVEPRRRLVLTAQLGAAYTQFGDLRGLPFLEEALAGLDAAEEPTAVAVALRSRARYHHLAGQHRAAIPLLEQALALSEQFGDVADVAAVLAWLAGAYQHMAEYGKSNAWARRIIEIDERRSTPLAGALGWEFLAENAAGAGRIREAIEFARRDRELGERVHDGSRLAWADYTLGWTYHSAGDLAAAAEALERSASWAARTGDRRAARLCEATSVLVATDRGDDDAAQRAAACLENADETGLLWLRLEARRATAYRELWWGDPAKTVAIAEECRALLAGTDAQQTNLFLGPIHAEALVWLGRSAEAGEVLARTAELARRAEAPLGELACRRVRGLLRALGGDADGAVDDLDAAVAGLEALGARLELARALAARAALRDGRADGSGRADRERVADLLVEAGAETLLRQWREQPPPGYAA